MGRRKLTMLLSGWSQPTLDHGGATWVVLQYALGFKRLGHDVHIIEPTGGRVAATRRGIARRVAKRAVFPRGHRRLRAGRRLGAACSRGAPRRPGPRTRSFAPSPVERTSSSMSTASWPSPTCLSRSRSGSTSTSMPGSSSSGTPRRASTGASRGTRFTSPSVRGSERRGRPCRPAASTGSRPSSRCLLERWPIADGIDARCAHDGRQLARLRLIRARRCLLRSEGALAPAVHDLADEDERALPAGARDPSGRNEGSRGDAIRTDGSWSLRPRSSRPRPPTAASSEAPRPSSDSSSTAVSPRRVGGSATAVRATSPRGVRCSRRKRASAAGCRPARGCSPSRPRRAPSLRSTS